MSSSEDTTFLDITELNSNNFRIFDGAQRYKDFDEETGIDSESDDDMLKLFRLNEGSY